MDLQGNTHLSARPFNLTFQEGAAAGALSENAISRCYSRLIGLALSTIASDFESAPSNVCANAERAVRRLYNNPGL